jgi:hypothetical protein
VDILAGKIEESCLRIPSGAREPYPHYKSNDNKCEPEICSSRSLSA